MTAMQHVDGVNRGEAERLFAAGVQYTDEEQRNRQRKLDALHLSVLLKQATVTFAVCCCNMCNSHSRCCRHNCHENKNKVT